jgi:hypothetical protein
MMWSLNSRRYLEGKFEAIQSQLNCIYEQQQKNHKELMSTAKDLQTTQDTILALVQQGTTNLTQLATDMNSELAILKAQDGPVTQEQLDSLVAQGAGIVTSLQAMNAAITTEDTAVAQAPAATSTDAATAEASTATAK